MTGVQTCALPILDKRISRIAFASAITRSPGSGEVLLHRLDDVDYASLTNAANGQVLIFNSQTKKWQAGTVTANGSASIVTVGTAELGNLNENDIVVTSVTGGVVTSNTVAVLTSALNNALARITDLENRLTSAGIP